MQSRKLTARLVIQPLQTVTEDVIWSVRPERSLTPFNCVLEIRLLTFLLTYLLTYFLMGVILVCRRRLFTSYNVNVLTTLYMIIMKRKYEKA